MANKDRYQLIILEEASEEMFSLYEFYESRSPGLGNLFWDRLGECLYRIENRPESWQYARTASEQIRRGIISQPPVIVLYIFEKPEIRILSVKDARSNWY